MSNSVANNRFPLTILFIAILSCNHANISEVNIIKFDLKLIDTLKNTSDTAYSQLIGRADFYTADYYIDRKNNVITKILKDSLGNVVGLNKSKDGETVFAAEYYSNGQLIGKTQFLPGKVDGPATYYYPDGRIKSIGQWHDYRQYGIWKDYDKLGRLIKITTYNDNGDVLKSEMKSYNNQ